MSVTLVHKDGLTLTFRSGSFVVSPPEREALQVKSDSEGATARVASISANRIQKLKVRMRYLQKADEDSYAGFDSFIGMLETTLDYSMYTCCLTDADSDSWTVRYWEPQTFSVEENPKDSFSGEIVFRVEN